jgi:hypothetical protein
MGMVVDGGGDRDGDGDGWMVLGGVVYVNIEGA